MLWYFMSELFSNRQQFYVLIPQNLHTLALVDFLPTEQEHILHYTDETRCVFVDEPVAFSGQTRAAALKQLSDATELGLHARLIS